MDISSEGELTIFKVTKALVPEKPIINLGIVLGQENEIQE